MTALEIILICIVVWLIGIIVVLWLDRVCKAYWEDIFVTFLWFIAFPYYLIYHTFKNRKVPYQTKCGYDADHARVLKLPFGREKFLIYHHFIAFCLADKDDFNEQDVAKGLQDNYRLSKRQMKYLRKTGQLEEITNKLKAIE